MGLILIFIWLAALSVTLMVGGTLAGLIGGISKRGRPFWWSGFVALLLSVVLQYGVAFGPYVQRGTYGIELMLVPILTWTLAAPAVPAAILWFVFKARRSPALSGATAGLLLSIPAAVALALPMTFVLPGLVPLRFTP